MTKTKTGRPAIYDEPMEVKGISLPASLLNEISRWQREGQFSSFAAAARDMIQRASELKRRPRPAK